MVMAKQVNLQILPRSHGSHAGLRGAFTLFEFNEDVHSPVVYVEGQAGNLYLEKEADLKRCSGAYEQLQAAALSTKESVKLLGSLIEQMDSRPLEELPAMKSDVTAARWRKSRESANNGGCVESPR